MINFPEDFDWGIASSAYQIEGGYAADGKGLNIWDVFCRQPGSIAGGDTGDISADHYHRWKQDVELIAALGVKSYRLSVSWARVLPEGRGRVNQSGLDFYKNLVEQLLNKGIQPVVNLHHYDLPVSMYEKGGWPSRDTGKAYEEYAQLLFDTLGDTVHRWITANDVRGTLLGGYVTGERAPGRKGELGAAIQGWHNLNLACAGAVARWKEKNIANSEIGGVMGVIPVYPADGTPQSASLADWLWLFYNEAFITPLLQGVYPDLLMDLLEKQGMLPEMLPDDLACLQKGRADFIGISYYTPMRVKPNPDALPGNFMNSFERVQAGKKTESGWEIYPEGMYDTIMKIHRRHQPKIYIAETGGAFPDNRISNGVIQDDDRIEYLSSHFREVARAIGEGANVQGIHVWTLFDNFEWQQGYSKKFGLYGIDRDTLKRVPKKSAGWYNSYIAKSKAHRNE